TAKPARRRQNVADEGTHFRASRTCRSMSLHPPILVCHEESLDRRGVASHLTPPFKSGRLSQSPPPFGLCLRFVVLPGLASRVAASSIAVVWRRKKVASGGT